MILFRYEARDNCTTIMRSYSRPLLGMERNETGVGAVGSLCWAITANVIRGALKLTVLACEQEMRAARGALLNALRVAKCALVQMLGIQQP